MKGYNVGEKNEVYVEIRVHKTKYEQDSRYET